MFSFMTTNKKQQCYPLWFFSWRPKKNDSVTPYVSFDKNDSVTPHVSFDKNDRVTPCVFFHDDQRKTTVLPPMFYLINIDSVTPYVFFHDDQRKTTVIPYIPLYFIWERIFIYFLIFIFSLRPIKYDSVTHYILFDKNNSVTPYVFIHDDQ